MLFVGVPRIFAARLRSIVASNDLFFRKLFNLSNCIHHLLPPPRDNEIMSRLRRATTYPHPRNRTNCYKYFIHQSVSQSVCRARTLA